jgi:hypothetical protein
MRWLAAIVLAFPCAALAADVEDFVFSGPSPARNFQPIQLIFLHLPFERARVLEPGEISFHVDSAESNEIATSDNDIQASLKFETNRTVLGGRWSPADHWEVGLDVPFITRYGGFLDPLIDAVESAFDTKNSERDLFPQNSFGSFVVQKKGVTLFEDRKEDFVPGDLWFSAKRDFELPAPWPTIALRGAIKAPSGDADKVTGSGKPDFGIGIAAEHRPLRRLMLFMNLDLVYPVGPITDGDLHLNPFFSESFAAELAVTRRWSALLHQAVYTSPFHGNGARLLDGTVVELGLGINFAFREWLGAQLLAINNVSGVEQAADFTLMLSLHSRGWSMPFVSTRASAELPPLSEVPPPAEPLPEAPPGPTDLPPLREELPAPAAP